MQTSASENSLKDLIEKLYSINTWASIRDIQFYPDEPDNLISTDLLLPYYDFVIGLVERCDPTKLRTDYLGVKLDALRLNVGERNFDNILAALHRERQRVATRQHETSTRVDLMTRVFEVALQDAEFELQPQDIMGVTNYVDPLWQQSQKEMSNNRIRELLTRQY